MVALEEGGTDIIRARYLAADSLTRHQTEYGLMVVVSHRGLGLTQLVVEAQRTQVDRIWRQRLERLDHTVDRARRQHQLTEPENRLVVRQLEEDGEAGPCQKLLSFRS